MRSVLRCAAFAAAFALAGPALAQAPAAPDPAALSAARDVVTKMQGDRSAVLASVATPMVGLVQQMGVTGADRAQVLVTEVVMPLLAERFDGLLDVQARAFAAALPVADLRAVAAFYDTPAGKNFAAAQPRLAQAQIQGMTQWLGGITPELQTRLAEAVKSRGWGATTPARRP